MSQWRQNNIGGKIVPSKHDQPYRVPPNPFGEKPAERTGPTPTFNPGPTPAQRKAREWLKSSIRPMLALDQLDPDDLAVLPPNAREKAKAMARRCGELHAEGAHVEAAVLAEESAVVLEGMLPEDWSPPHGTDDPGELARLVRGN